jgi:molecular chaperone DnaJ
MQEVQVPSPGFFGWRKSAPNGEDTGADASSPRPRPRRGRDAAIRLGLELAETALGAVREVVVDTAVVCDGCGGLGTAPGTSAIACRGCRGTGEEPTSGNTGNTANTGEAGSCAGCRGSGVTIPSPCPACRGDGRVRARRTLSVRFPAGVEHGMRIQLAGQGEVGPGGGPAADLYVEVSELPHPQLRRDGNDLHLTWRIPPALARSGGTIQVPTLDGPTPVSVPAGWRSGTLRLTGFGVPRLRSQARGDLVIHVQVDAPGQDR